MFQTVIPSGWLSRIRESAFFRYQRARELARTSKRLDICAAQFAHVLHLAGPISLEGKTCLEVGAGWVLSHALVCHLLGAAQVIAADIQPQAEPRALDIAVRESIGSLPREILSPFAEPARIRERFAGLTSIPRFGFDALTSLGILYQSPVDFSRQKPAGEFDFIYSFSVLEHVPEAQVGNLLGNLAASLKPGGIMLHCIHLEDHQDIEGRPFDFLGLAGQAYGPGMESSRGNRLRASAWFRLFSALGGVQSTVLYAHERTERGLPGTIDPRVSFTDEHDLRISHLGVLSRKPALG